MGGLDAIVMTASGCGTAVNAQRSADNRRHRAVILSGVKHL
jgi:hypothetical protein